MQDISLIWGILALVGMLAGFVPFYGALNWLVIPFAGIGAIVSAIALGTAPAEVQGEEHRRAYRMRHRDDLRPDSPGRRFWRRLERLTIRFTLDRRSRQIFLPVT